MNARTMRADTGREIARSAFVALDWLKGSMLDTFSPLMVVGVYDVWFGQFAPITFWVAGGVLWLGVMFSAALGAGAIAHSWPDIECED